MKNKVLVLVRDATRKDFENDLNNLDLPDLEVFIPENEQAILDNIKDVNIIFGNPTIAKNYVNSADKLV